MPFPFQDPRAKTRRGPFSADDATLGQGAAAPAPTAPPAKPVPTYPQAFEGARDLAGAVNRANYAATHLQPPTFPAITANTSPAELRQRSSNTRWNFRPGGENPETASWQTSPDGPRGQHMSPAGFLLPRGALNDAEPATAAPAASLADPRAPSAAQPKQPETTIVDNGAPGSATSLANVTGGVLPAPAAAKTKQPGVDSGVDIGGRRLNYGAMVNGVPTFSDGSGGPNGRQGSIPRTVSAATMANLAKAPSVGRADAGVLSMPLASDAMGGATPSSAQMVAQRMSQIRQPITGSRPTPEQFAEADRLAIASRDPRSAAGTAARNLSLETEFARTPRSRAAAAQALQQLSTGTDAANLQGIQDEAAMARTQVNGANTLANTAMAGQNEQANTRLTNTIRKPGTQFADDKGNLWLSDATTGASTPVTGADGKQLKQAVTRDDSATKRTQAVQDQLSKGVQALLTEYQKNQALLPADQQAPPPPELIQQWKEQQAAAMSLPIVRDNSGRALANINGQWVSL